MDAMRLLGGLLGNNALGGSLGGQVMNTLGRSLGGGRRSNTTASLLGGLAVAAVQHYMRSSSTSNASRQPTTPSLAGLMGTSPPALDTSRSNDQAQLLVEAMIAAAKADGQVDREEQSQILGKLGELGADELQFIREVMARPVDLDDLVRRTPADMRTSLYGASLAAIRVDTHEEAVYLRQLASKLGLDRQSVAAIHSELGVPPPQPG